VRCRDRSRSETGEEIWRVKDSIRRTIRTSGTIASATFYDGLCTRQRENRFSFQTGRIGDITKNVAWQFQNGPDVPTPVMDGKYFYSINDRGIVYVLGCQGPGRDLRRPTHQAGTLFELPDFSPTEGSTSPMRWLTTVPKPVRN